MGDSVKSTFQLQVQASLNDMMVLFTDYDDTHEDFNKLIEDDCLNDDETKMEMED